MDVNKKFQMITKRMLNESYDESGFNFYVLNPKNRKIAAGSKTADDAFEFIKEITKINKNIPALKVFRKDYLNSQSIDPKDDENWKDILDVSTSNDNEESIMNGLNESFDSFMRRYEPICEADLNKDGIEDALPEPGAKIEPEEDPSTTTPPPATTPQPTEAPANEPTDQPEDAGTEADPAPELDNPEIPAKETDETNSNAPLSKEHKDKIRKWLLTNKNLTGESFDGLVNSMKLNKPEAYSYIFRVAGKLLNDYLDRQKQSKGQ